MNFEIRALLDDINFGLTVRSELNHQIYEVLTTHGIEIPFRQRDIWIRNPEALGGARLWPDLRARPGGLRGPGDAQGVARTGPASDGPLLSHALCAQRPHV